MGRNDEDAVIDYDVELRETPAAFLFLIDDNEVWVPKSQIVEHDTRRSRITIPQWLAEEKELV